MLVDTIKKDKINLPPYLALSHLLTLHHMMAQPEDSEVVSVVISEFQGSKTKSQYTSLNYKLHGLGPGGRCHLVKFHASIEIGV